MLANVFNSYINQKKITSIKFRGDTKFKENIWTHQMWKTVGLWGNKQNTNFMQNRNLNSPSTILWAMTKIWKIFWAANNILKNVSQKLARICTWQVPVGVKSVFNILVIVIDII